MVTRRDVVAGAALSVIVTGGGARAGAQAGVLQTTPPVTPPTLDEFYAPPATADFALSPSGDRIAVLRNRVTPQGVEAWVDVFDARDLAAPPRPVRLGSHEASTVAWANDRRLLVWILYDVTRKGYPPESIVRVISLNDDGSSPAVLFGNRDENLRWIHDLGAVVDYLPDEPDHVLMKAWEAKRGLPALYKVDVNTGTAVVLEYGALRTGAWLTQRGTPMIRLDADRRGSTTRIMARAPGERDWKFVHAFRDDQAPEFSVFGATGKPGVFLGAARMPGEDKISVREVELAGLKIGPPLLTPEKVDVRGVLLDPGGGLLATGWREDRRVYEFTDKAFAAHFKGVEAYFGPELDIAISAVDERRTRLLGIATGPREPAVFFHYDRASRAVTELGRKRPHLSPDRLGPMRSLDVRTRDGSQVRAYLTSPASGAPGPLVVMPHGGPERRDDWGYDLWAQALAAQGWWVLQVNFRGSGGYGLEFAKAGRRRWGGRMQEDLEDAADHAIGRYGLDARRVAIMGASYGGYAALIGAVRRPDFYKAVVSIAGVSDLVQMLQWERSEDDTPGKEHYEFWRTRIGDPKADAAELAAASPRQRASEINAAVFLVHGRWDGVVPVEQSRIMAKALKAAGKSVELWEIKHAGHSPANPAADQAMLERCIAFLAPALA